jgi:hypothetical protein
MPEKNTHHRSPVRPLQPLISLTPRAVALALRLHLLHSCSNCGSPLATHIDHRNQWIDCKAGAR